MIHFNLLPELLTIPAGQLHPGDVLVEASTYLLGMIQIDTAYEYDEQVHCNGRSRDLFEATNLDGVGPFFSEWHMTYTWDEEVTIFAR